MTLIRPAAFLSLAAWFLLPLHAQSNDGHKQFGRWTATCAANAYCTVSTRLTRSGHSGYAYQLRVSRFQSGVQEIAFLPAAAPPAQDAAISVSVDRRKPIVVEAGRGYRRAGNSNTFVFDPAMSEELLRAMRGGQRVTFSYASSGRKPAAATFSLMGLGQALKYAGITPPAPEAAAAAETKAAPEPAPVVQEKKATRKAGSAAARQRAPETRESAAPVDPTDAPEAASEAPQPPPPRTPEPQASSAAAPPPPPALPAPSLEDATAETKPRSPPPASASHKRTKAVLQFACRGNEPSWSLVIDHDNARYLGLRGSEPEAVPLKGKLKVTGEGRTPDVAWRGKAADGSAYKALIQEQACRDTMVSSEEGRAEFPYRARLTLPSGKVVQGCCDAGLQIAERSPPAQASLDQAPVANLFAKQPDDWSRFLLELKPAIDGCIEQTPGGSAYVTKAWPMNRGLVGVRTRNAVAGWFDCVAQYDGRIIERFEAVTADAGPLPGEGYVLFTPRDGTPLSGNCWRHERVVDPSGNALGWLSTNGC